MHDILIAIGGSIGTLGLVALLALLVRVWRTPKRLDRLERVVPAMARGVWALLGEHVRESNGETPQEIADAYKELTEVMSSGIVSQKAGR